MSRIRSSFNIDNWICIEIAHKFGRIYCCRHNDKLKRSLFFSITIWQPFMKNSHKNISIYTSFMCFIQYEQIIAYSRHHLSNRHTISSKYNSCLSWSLLLKSYIIANLFTDNHLHFFSNSFSQSDSTDSSRLRNYYFLEKGKHKFRNLSRLTASCVSTNDSYSIGFNCL